MQIKKRMAPVCFLSFSMLSVQAVEKIKESSRDFFYLAEKYRQTNNIDQAIIYYQKALECEPNHFESCFNLGNIYFSKDQLEEAVKHFKKALESPKRSPQLFLNTGICLKRLKRFTEAIEHLEQAVALQPNYTKAYLQLAQTFQDKGDNQKAIEIYLQILEQNPHDIQAHRYLGIVYRLDNQFDKALDHLHAAYILQPHDLQIMLELANTLVMSGNFDEALGILHKVQLLEPKSPAALINIAYILKHQGFVKEAIDMLKQVIEINPKNALAHSNLGLAYLTLGNFQEGWIEYEWRWKKDGKAPQRFSKPLWDGSDLQGKTILIWAEQGLGDTFQFIRYAKLIKKMGATIIFQSREQLVDIISLCDYLDYVIPPDKKLPNFDFHIPLMSLPLVFKTTEDTIPAEIPYLKADPELVKYWKEQLAADTHFKIGVCWQGNANYHTHFLQQTVASKSMSVSCFEPLAHIPGVSLYSLQMIYGTEQLKEIGESFAIHDFGPDFDKTHGRFMDTAAVIKNLNLVITVDTSISHLAAALGTPTWIILPEPADWRWMLNRTDTPWYPNVRLFRQPRSGDWTTTIQNIIHALQSFISSHAQTTSSSPNEQANTQQSALEGLADLERQNQQSTEQSSTNTTQKAFSSLLINELLDEITILALTADSKKEKECPEIQQAYELYNQNLATWPELKGLSQQLLYINRYLLNLKKQLDIIGINVLDKEFPTLARKLSRTLKFKQEIRKDIQKITDTYEKAQDKE